MQVRMFLTITSVLSLLFSAPVLAHLTDPKGVLPHFLTGEHLLVIVVVGVFVAGASKLYRRFR